MEIIQHKNKIILRKTRCLVCDKEKKGLFRFPKDYNRLLSWLKTFQREDLLHTLSREYIRNNARLCALHFKDESFTSSLRLRISKFAAPYAIEDRDKVLLDKPFDCNSGSSVFPPKLDCNSVQKINSSSLELIEKSFITVVSPSKTNERTLKTDKSMTNFSSPKVVKDALVTVITLCCTDKKEGIAFHRFLQDPEKRMHWISGIKHKNFKPSRISVLCPKHFNTDQIDCHSAFKVLLKENTAPNMFPSNALNSQEDVGLFQKCKEANPMDCQKMAVKDGFSKLHRNPKDIKRMYVAVKWNESVNRISKTKRSLQAGAISSYLPKSFPQTNKRLHINHLDARKSFEKSMVQFPTATRTGSIGYLSDNSGVKQVDLVNSVSGTEEEGKELNDSFFEADIEKRMEPINFASDMKEDGIDSNSSLNDTELERRLETEGDISYRNARSFAVPNEWWGITRTPQYIIFSKWNEFYDTVFRVVIENNYAKIFIKGKECVNENRKIPFENISALLQEVDSYKICAGIDDKTMTNCTGHLGNVCQEQFSVWCKSCQETRKELMNIL